MSNNGKITVSELSPELITLINQSGGGSVGSSESYEYIQPVAIKQWVINHNLNKFPSVTILDSSNNVVYGDILYVNSNSIILKFTCDFSGKAYLN